MSLKKQIDISTVIATVGEKSLPPLIKSINDGTVIPKEIIVVYADLYHRNLDQDEYKNLKILVSPQKGQVFQRSYGISKSKSDIILQLDADIIIKKNTIENLLQAYISKGPKVAIGAQVKIFNKEGIVEKKTNYLKKIFGYFGGGNINIVNGKNPFRFDQWFVDYTQPVRSQFVNIIPGGCMLFNKKYYKNYNYYPLTGRALGEDILNSIHLKIYGNRLYYEKEAIILQPVSGGYDHKSIKELYNFFYKVYVIKKQVCNLAQGNLFRFHIWMGYFVLTTFVKYLYSNIMCQD